VLRHEPPRLLPRLAADLRAVIQVHESPRRIGLSIHGLAGSILDYVSGCFVIALGWFYWNIQKWRRNLFGGRRCRSAGGDSSSGGAGVIGPAVGAPTTAAAIAVEVSAVMVVAAAMAEAVVAISGASFSTS
jgi:hypothetical protein